MDVLILDHIKEQIEKLKAGSKYTEINDLLVKQDMSVKTPIIVLLTYLRETKTIAQHLPFRTEFINKIKESIIQRSNDFLKAVEDFS